jgi:5'(3')-deoxyribonucleotidase
MNMKKKKTLFIDMDGVLVDFVSAFPLLDEKIKKEYKDNMDDIDGIFGLMLPMPHAIESFRKLAQHFDTYILSTAAWNNPSAWSDKLKWVKRYLPKELAHKRLILSHNKNLNTGDYLIDDRIANGVDKFKGQHIHFGQKDFPDWDTVVSYLLEKEGINEKV